MKICTPSNAKPRRHAWGNAARAGRTNPYLISETPDHGQGLGHVVGLSARPQDLNLGTSNTQTGALAFPSPFFHPVSACATIIFLGLQRELQRCSEMSTASSHKLLFSPLPFMTTSSAISNYCLAFQPVINHLTSSNVWVLCARGNLESPVTFNTWRANCAQITSNTF